MPLAITIAQSLLLKIFMHSRLKSREIRDLHTIGIRKMKRVKFKAKPHPNSKQRQACQI